MKSNDLAKWCIDHPNIDVYVEQHIYNDENECIGITYHEFELADWEPSNPISHYTIVPTEMVSG